jgi:hypothetical protein
VKTTSTAARVLSRQKLFYEAGADAARDRPAHVRAGSGCAVVDVPGQGKRLAVVQDDANFIALVDTKTGKVGHIELPAGPGGLRQFDKLRGNKADKLDLESMAAVVVDGKAALFCMGSGSTARREAFVLVTLAKGSAGDPHPAPVVEELAAGAFFKGLHNNHVFAGDELNVEGLVVDGDGARFFNRGNGAGEARDAVGEVSFSALLRHLRDPLLHAAPQLQKVKDFDLGAVDGVRLTFTDATKHPDGRTLFLAAAEDSPNTYDDGDVKGTAIGVLGDDGRAAIVPLLDERGHPLTDKVEGIAIDPNDPKKAFVVIDKDDPTAPAELLVVQLP